MSGCANDPDLSDRSDVLGSAARVDSDRSPERSTAIATAVSCEPPISESLPDESSERTTRRCGVSAGTRPPGWVVAEVELGFSPVPLVIVALALDGRGRVPENQTSW